MHADVSFGKRAENGVHERVQDDVGIRMARQSAPMRDAHAAERDVIAIAKLVDIEAETGAHIAQGCKLGHFSAAEIIVGGDLHVPSLTLERGDLEARPFGERGVVGEIVTPRGGGPLVRIQKGGKAECLRGLHHAQVSSVDRAGHATCRVDGLDGVRDGDHRHRRATRARGRDRTRDQGVRRKRPRGIVHQHKVRAMTLQCLEAGANGGLSGSAAMDRRQEIEARNRRLEERGIIAVDDWLDRRDSAVPRQRGQARPDHRLAQNEPVLLGQIAASSEPAACCHYDGCDFDCHVRNPKPHVAPWL